MGVFIAVSMRKLILLLFGCLPCTPLWCSVTALPRTRAKGQPLWNTHTFFGGVVGIILGTFTFSFITRSRKTV